MAEVSITKQLSDLRELFNQMKEVYFTAKTNQDLATLSELDMEWPVLQDGGVTFNTGEVDVTKVKITTGDTWTSIATAGDSDIQLQVASVAADVTKLLMNQKVADVTMTATFDGVTYGGAGYDLSPKKNTGGLFFRSEDRESAIFLPNIESYSSFVSEDGKPAYFNVVITPLNDTKGAAFYILKKKA